MKDGKGKRQKREEVWKVVNRKRRRKKINEGLEISERSTSWACWEKWRGLDGSSRRKGREGYRQGRI